MLKFRHKYYDFHPTSTDEVDEVVTFKELFDKSIEYEGSLESVEEKTDKAFGFASSALEIMYRKGIITKFELEEVIKDILGFDYDNNTTESLEVLKLEEKDKLK